MDNPFKKARAFKNLGQKKRGEKKQAVHGKSCHARILFLANFQSKFFKNPPKISAEAREFWVDWGVGSNVTYSKRSRLLAEGPVCCKFWLVLKKYNFLKICGKDFFSSLFFFGRKKMDENIENG